MLKSTSRRRVLNASLDALESRRLLSAVPWNLSNGSLLQNWENTGLISQNDNWQNVPSIEGFFQPGSPANRDPRMILSDTGAELDVTANLTSGNVSNGGVLELQLAPPIAGTGNGTVALQPTNTAADTFLKIYLDNSGRDTPVRIRYDLIDVDNTAATTGVVDARQPAALQYRLSTSGPWVNVPQGYVDFAADFVAGAVGQTTTVDVTLPANTANAPTLQVRILTTNTNGNDQAVAVDNLRVFGTDVFGFDPTSYSVIENVGVAQVVVKRLGDTVGSATVDYVVTNGSAVSPDDFIAASGTLTFPNGVDSQTIGITIVNDGTGEDEESFTVNLLNPSAGFSLGTNSTATVTITDNDAKLPNVLLNEVKVNPPDTDGSAEYVELRSGGPNESLANVYFVAVEGDSGGAVGTADFVVDLSSASLGSNGYLVLAADGTSVPAGTTLVTDPDFALPAGLLENGTNSFLLIYSLTPIVEGVDLDANNDGALELPAGAVVVDGIGSDDGGVGDVVYGPSLPLPALAGSFHAATRRADNLTPMSVQAWYGGALIDPSLGSASETGIYDPRATGATANRPLGAVLTPGSANYSTSTDGGSFVFVPISTEVQENAGTVSFMVYRAGGATGPAMVTVSPSGGTATAGVDYADFTQTLSFANGDFQETFTITVNDDGNSEVAETVGIALSNPTGAGIFGEGVAQLMIAISDAVAPTGVLLNELDINPPGTDHPYEYIELRGQPGTQLVNVYLLAIEGTGTAAGTVDQVINLSGATFGSNGLLLVKAASGGFTPEDPLTGVFATSVLDNSTFENDTNTFLLVFVPTAESLPSANTDLDPDNVGALALEPNVILLDSIATLAPNDPDVIELAYGDAVLPPVTITGDGSDALARFAHDADPFDASAWYYGNLLTTNSDPAQKRFSPTQISSNFPAGTLLTPGAANAGVGDTIAPTVSGSVFNFMTASGVQQSVTVTFSEDVGASLTVNDFQLVNLDDNSVVSLTLANVGSNGTVATLTFSDTGNSLNGAVLKDGHYRLRVLAGQVSDAAGNVIGTDVDSNFAFKNADFDGDLDVDFDNLLTLAQNYGGSGKTFAQGDANYDGNVNFDDLLALAQRYGTSLFGTTAISPTKKTPARRTADVIA